MVKVVNNVVKCLHCSAYVEYDESDIKTEYRSYGVMTYAGETYIAKIITCPKCGRKIEVY